MSNEYSVWFLSCSWLWCVCQESENSAEARFFHRNALLVSLTVSGMGMVDWRSNLRLPEVTWDCCREERTAARAPGSACWVWAQAAALRSAVILAKLLSFPVPQLPPLRNQGSQVVMSIKWEDTYRKCSIKNTWTGTPRKWFNSCLIQQVQTEWEALGWDCEDEQFLPSCEVSLDFSRPLCFLLFQNYYLKKQTNTQKNHENSFSFIPNYFLFFTCILTWELSSFLACLLLTLSLSLSLPFYSSFSCSLPSLLSVQLYSLSPPVSPVGLGPPSPLPPPAPSPGLCVLDCCCHLVADIGNCSRTWPWTPSWRHLSKWRPS